MYRMVSVPAIVVLLHSRGLDTVGVEVGVLEWVAAVCVWEGCSSDRVCDQLPLLRLKVAGSEGVGDAAGVTVNVELGVSGPEEVATGEWVGGSDSDA